MRHHTASYSKELKGWHYVSAHPRRGTYPIGYCAEHPPHATAQEARECYAAYQRDRVRLDVSLGSWSDCLVCGGPAKTGATIEGDGYALAVLCTDHLTIDDAIRELGLSGAAGDAWVT